MNGIKHSISKLYNDIKQGVITEFRDIFHDRGALLLIVIALPLYTIIYSTAYGSEVVRNIAIAVVDDDKTASSRELITGILSGPNTQIRYNPQSLLEAKSLFLEDKIFGIVYIPSGFERKLLSNTETDIGLILDGSHLLLYRQVLEQVTSDALTKGATVELMNLIDSGENKPEAMTTIEPIVLNTHHLYNPSLGYGTFVMPSVVMVLIQQTLVIGLAMMAARRRKEGLSIEPISLHSIMAKLLVYYTIYGINLTIILCTIWTIFGFQY
jgi:ABC-2 type transport system permease protein